MNFLKQKTCVKIAAKERKRAHADSNLSFKKLGSRTLRELEQIEGVMGP